MEENRKSIAANILYSGIKAFFTIIFPLLSFKYASNVLGVESLGKVNYASSINSLMVSISGLGISSYAVREFARVRNDKSLFERKASYMFTLNLITAFITYLIYFGIFLFIPNTELYWKLCVVLSTQIFFNAIGTEWVNIIYEDYLFITLRSIFVQISCFLGLICFVKSPNDYLAYVVIVSLSTVLPNVFNWFYCKKYCKLSLRFDKEILEYIKPILYLFSTNLAIYVFVNSDMILLGYFSGDYYTGLYSVATKVYFALKQMLQICIMVAIPRISYLLGQENGKIVNKLLNEIVNFIVVASIPIVVGLIILHKSIILLISDSSYLESGWAFIVLACTLFICSISFYYSNCIMIPYKLEKELLFSTIIGALFNIALNVFLIPKYNHIGAAFTTLIAEALVLICNIYIVKKHVKISIDFKNLIQITIATTAFAVFDIMAPRVNGFYTNLIVTISRSVLIYLFVLIVLKNRYILTGIESIKNRLKK